MRELALHILDIAQNSVAAGARHIWLTVSENEQGYFVFSVRDDGKGMDSEMLQRVRDPFVTSRTTRKVGMGIPFIDMVTQQCGGHLELQSAPGKGTELTAYFAADNIDRPVCRCCWRERRSWSWNLPITAPTARWCSERRRSEKY